MKGLRIKGLNLLTYLDDASHCVTGAAPLKESISENAVAALRQAVGKFGVPATILPDNGSFFIGAKWRKKSFGIRTLTLFEDDFWHLT